MSYFHTPVLLKEVIEYLDPEPGQNFIDCTVGGGGHALEIVKRVMPKGKVLGIDLDSEALKAVNSKIKNSKLKNNLILVQDNFKNLKKVRDAKFNYRIYGVLLDLGVSSHQLKKGERGFSFQTNGPLDMRFARGQGRDDGRQVVTAEELIAKWPEEELVRIFKEYGEEPRAKRIAHEIVRQRNIKPIKTTKQLSDIIESLSPSFLGFERFSRKGWNKLGQRFEKIKKPGSQKGPGKDSAWTRKVQVHPATRVFQALRMAVNSELENLKQTLPQALDILEPGARLAVISFHSLEDRIVKEFFKRESRDCICPPSFPICRCGHKARLKVITKKPVTPTIEEVRSNPRSRSGRMRVAEKV